MYNLKRFFFLYKPGLFETRSDFSFRQGGNTLRVITIYPVRGRHRTTIVFIRRRKIISPLFQIVNLF